MRAMNPSGKVEKEKLPKTIHVPKPFSFRRLTRCAKRGCMLSKVEPGFSRMGTPPAAIVKSTISIDLSGKEELLTSN